MRFKREKNYTGNLFLRPVGSPTIALIVRRK